MNQMEDTDVVAERFVARPVGTNGHEILFDEEVVAWAADNFWAAIIVESLRRTTAAVSHRETDQ